MPETLWTINHKQHDGTLIHSIRPENLKFTLNKKPPHNISYEMSLSRPEVSPDFIGPYRTDFELKYGSTTIMAGMHTSVNLGINSDVIEITGKDWWHYLELRHYPFDPNTPHPPAAWPGSTRDYVIGSPAAGLVYETNADVAVVIKNLLDQTLGRPNSLAMTYPTLTTSLGIPSHFSLSAADTTMIAGHIDSLSEIDPGFVYECLYTKEIRLYSPQKYNTDVWDTPAHAIHIFDTDEGIIDLDYTNNGPAATHWLGTGGGTGDLRLGAAKGLPANQAVYRRIDGTEDYGDLPNRDIVVARTMSDLKVYAQPQHDIMLTVDPQFISNFWSIFTAGQAIWIDIDLDAHHIDSAQEIMNMECEVSNEGDAKVVMGCDQIYDAGTAGVDQA